MGSEWVELSTGTRHVVTVTGEHATTSNPRDPAVFIPHVLEFTPVEY